MSIPAIKVSSVTKGNADQIKEFKMVTPRPKEPSASIRRRHHWRLRW